MRRNGFVLVAVLAMLVILSLLAGTVALVAQRVRDDQLERQRMLQARIDMESTQASVLYLLLTQRMTFGGLTVDERVVLSDDERRAAANDREDVISFMPTGNEIAMDGTTNRGLADIRFALQDDRGLIAFNWTPPAILEGLLEQGRDESGAGPAAPRVPVATLRNLLMDYQDPDDLYRLNSAEADGYRREGLPAPANRVLATPLELRRIKEWDKAIGFLDDREIVGTLTATRSAQININTAPALVLASLPGVDLEMAARAVDARVLAPFISLSGFEQLLGAAPADEGLLSLYPLPSGTLTLWPAGGGAVQVLHWTLTPLDDGGRPWREDYEFTLPQSDGDTGQAARTPATPVFADAVPASG